jgi:hypothetical protein
MNSKKIPLQHLRQKVINIMDTKALIFLKKAVFLPYDELIKNAFIAKTL